MIQAIVVLCPNHGFHISTLKEHHLSPLAPSAMLGGNDLCGSTSEVLSVEILLSGMGKAASLTLGCNSKGQISSRRRRQYYSVGVRLLKSTSGASAVTGSSLAQSVLWSQNVQVECRQGMWVTWSVIPLSGRASWLAGRRRIELVELKLQHFRPHVLLSLISSGEEVAAEYSLCPTSSCCSAPVPTWEEYCCMASGGLGSMLERDFWPDRLQQLRRSLEYGRHMSPCVGIVGCLHTSSYRMCTQHDIMYTVTCFIHTYLLSSQSIYALGSVPIT